MKTIEARFKIVTPMFLGDANQKATGLRPPSVKGALRFWWRAIQWGRVRAECRDDAEALRLLHAKEARLFGSASGGSAGGQGRFLLRVDAVNLEKMNPTELFSRYPPGDGQQYLLGQGLWNYKTKYSRSALTRGEFSVRLALKPGPADKLETDLRELEEALLAWGLLGGLGSRARKGFGSVAVQSIKGGNTSVPRSSAEWKAMFSRWPLHDGVAPFTAFSAETRVVQVEGSGNAWSQLGSVGLELQRYRSYGKEKKLPNGKTAEQNFKPDHDNVHGELSGSRMREAPARGVFGFPHNYFFSSSNKKVDLAPNGADRGRRASPLFIHIHEFPAGDVVAMLSVFPAVFLPPRDRIRVKPKNGTDHDVEMIPDWQVIHRFLNRFNPREELLS